MSLVAMVPAGGARSDALRPAWVRPAALGGAVALHALVAFAFLHPAALEEPPETIVDVTLAPEGPESPAPQAQAPAPSAAPESPPAAAAPAEPAASPTPTDTATPTPTEEATPVAAPTETAVPPPLPVPAPAEPAPAPPKPAPAPPKPAPAPPKPKPTAAREPAPRPLPSPRPRARPSPAAAGADEGAPAATDRAARHRAARGPEAGGGERAGLPAGSGLSPSAYGALLAAEVARRRFYPAAARSAGASGTVGFVVTIGASGRVVGHAIVHSSGNAALDEAVATILEGVQLPPPPGGSFRGHMNLRFDLQ